jgi:NitT/TauT family transport system permease protein
MSPASVRSDRLLAVLAMLVFLAIWELLPAFKLVDPFFISSPSRIIHSAQWLFAHGLWNDIRVSLLEFLLGMGLAIILGVLLGWALGWYHTLNVIAEPFVTMMNAAPRVALLPLLILWLGIGIESKIAAVFMGAFFPIIFTVMKGVRMIDKSLFELARSFGANDAQVFTTLAIPSTVPYIMAGLQIAVGRGLVGVVLGELLAAQSGVGYMMSRASATFQTDKVFVGLILLTGFGYVLTEIIKMIEKYFESWRF